MPVEAVLFEPGLDVLAPGQPGLQRIESSSPGIEGSDPGRCRFDGLLGFSRGLLELR
jgi:hypothetical protein